MNVEKKIPVTRSSMPDLGEYIEEISDLWETHWLTNMGIKHENFQQKLKETLNVHYLDLLTNGHMALELALQAFEFDGGEVITTPFTFASTTHAIVRNGLTPVFCDISEKDFTMDTSKIENLITEKTKAILPVHVYGNICNVEEIQRIAEKYNLKVIYDAAHAFAEKRNGESIAHFGDVSCFSFHATKVFNSIEGGAVTFKDPEFGKKIYNLKNFGIQNEEEVNSIGANAKMNEFCAAMGLCNLRHLKEEIEKREKVFEKYVELLGDVEGIRINYPQEGIESNYSYFPIIVEDNYRENRNSLFEKLKGNGIIARKYFYPLTSQFSCYKGKFDNNETPIAQYICDRVITLPLFSDLEVSDVEKICNIILS